MNISVVGLGKLGSPMVAAFASRGHTVIGVDVNKKSVTALAKGRAPVVEPQLQSLIIAHRRRITATTDIRHAVLASDITFIIVPTPSTSDGGFSTSSAVSAAIDIGTALKQKKDYHLVVLTSTVLPRASQQDVIPALERASGKKCGKDFGFCYNPEFIALGSVIHDLLNPDFFLFGETDSYAGDVLEKFCRSISSVPIRRMNIVNAELTKIAVNTFVTQKISFANMVAQICDGLPGGNVDIVTAAIGSDTRIGSKYLKGGLGFGGPCFPRDNRAFSLTARNAKATNKLPKATDQMNREHLSFVVQKTRLLTPRGGKVTVLGLSYKPDTGVTEESHGLYLARELARQNFRVTCFDPGVSSLPKNFSRLTLASSLPVALRGATTICLATPWKVFRNLTPNQLPKGAILVDFWRVLNPKKFPKHRIVQFGINS